MATDEQFDELMSTWLEETAPAGLPSRALDAAFERTRRSSQQVRLGGLLRGMHVTRPTLALGGAAAIVVAAVLALGPRVGQPEVGVLPTTSDAWSRVSIASSWDVAQVDAIVAGPRGLLAILGELGAHDMQLSVSTDGRTWKLVPNDQFPSSAVLWPPQGSRRLPAVVTTDGFLFVADGNDVWASEDGSTWQRSADRAQDPDLRAGAIHAVAAGGLGLIAVGGDNKAWYSEDGSDWILAEVPAPPESFAPEGYSAPTVEMQGIAASGDALVAWGNAIASSVAGDTMVEPVLWTSDDGMSWAKVSNDAGPAWLLDVAAGPDGLVAIDGATGNIWFSADGMAWQPAAVRDDNEATPGLTGQSIAAAGSGYVAAATQGGCDVEPCPDARAVIWTSPDGRSWSRVQSDDLFVVADPRSAPNSSGATAGSAAAWGPQFVVAGAYDASPVIWISGTPATTTTPIVKPTPSVSTDPRTPFLGVWASTSDGDGGTQRMTVERSANNSVEIVVRDTVATVCAGTSSTMTGTGAIDRERLVIPTPEYRCDDGTEPQPMGGPGLNEELRNLTYTRDAATDTLSVGIGDVWLREGAEPRTPAPQPSESEVPTAEPIAGQIKCGNQAGNWSYPATTDQLTSEVLGCSEDGSRILIQKGDENLYVLHADGSVTQVTEQLSGLSEIVGSGRPAGATISPDGSRVVFAGVTKRESFCHDGALFAVSADGGPSEVLWTSQVPQNGILRYPSFSPDGTKIAFADGYCDSDHSVWVMNADGSDAHQVVSSDFGPLGATHVQGLAWSAAGDRIALATDNGTYTFATDGSATQDGATEFCWPGREC